MLAPLLRYFKKYPLLGLDLGYQELRLLQLEPRGKTYHLEKILTQPLSLTGSQQENKIDWQAGGTALQALVTQTGLSGAGVALALPSSVVLKKQLEFPLRLNEEELLCELRQRLSQYFPGLAEDEIHFDFTSPLEREERSSSLLLVAARKEQLHHPLSAVKRAGLRPLLVDVDLYALARVGAWYFFQDDAEPNPVAALLDLRWPLFSFLVFNRAELLFHHQWCVEREVFEEPVEQAATLIQQVRNVWQLCQATHPEVRMQFLGLAGESAELAGIEAVLQNHFPLPITVVNPFEKMTYASHLRADLLYPLAPRFLLCCGLAMRGGEEC